MLFTRNTINQREKKKKKRPYCTIFTSRGWASIWSTKSIKKKFIYEVILSCRLCPSSAVGKGPSRGGLRPVVIFIQCTGIVGRRVHVGLLQRVEVGPVIWYQVVLVKCL